MKKQYETPLAAMIVLSENDVLQTSGNDAELPVTDSREWTPWY